MSPKATIIYGLVDPRTEQLRYIGKTSGSAPRRLRAHLCRTNLTPKRHSSRWLSGLIAVGLRPEIIELEVVEPGGDWQDSERFWIAYFRFVGADLVNLTDGGEGVGGYRTPPERRLQMSQRFKGRQFDDEWRRKISAAKKGVPIRPLNAASEAARVASFRKTVRRRAEAKTHCAKGHALMGANLLTKEGSAWKGCRTCYRERQHVAYLRRRPPLKTPEQISQTLREVAKRPEIVEVHRASMRRRLADPEARQILLECTRKARAALKPEHFRRGENHQNSKLSWAAVDEIRRRCQAGEPRKDLGAAFGVALTTIDQIIQGKCWKPETRPSPPLS